MLTKASNDAGYRRGGKLVSPMEKACFLGKKMKATGPRCRML